MKNMNKSLLAMMLLASQLNYAEDGVPSESNFAAGMVQAMQDQVSQESYLSSLYHKFLAWMESTKMSDEEREEFYANDEDSRWSKEQDEKFAEERDREKRESFEDKFVKAAKEKKAKHPDKSIFGYTNDKEKAPQIVEDKPSRKPYRSASIRRSASENDESNSLSSWPTNADNDNSRSPSPLAFEKWQIASVNQPLPAADENPAYPYNSENTDNFVASPLFLNNSEDVSVNQSQPQVDENPVSVEPVIVENKSGSSNNRRFDRRNSRRVDKKELGFK